LLLLKAVLPDVDEASLLQALHSHQGDAQAAAQQLLYQHDNPRKTPIYLVYIT
jgi:hypothetical protein